MLLFVFSYTFRNTLRNQLGLFLGLPRSLSGLGYLHRLLLGFV